MTFRIFRFEEVDSTNSEAIRRARNGDAEGTVILADCQTAGRGRLGRSWESPPGKNLYCSFLFRPPFPPQDVVPITRMAAEAVMEMLEKERGEGSKEIKLTLKEPNDILLGGKKVCGILSEMGSEGSKTRWVVCGVGLNVNAEPSDFSEPLRKRATSLRIALGRSFDRERLLNELIDTMGRHYEEFVGR